MWCSGRAQERVRLMTALGSTLDTRDDEISSRFPELLIEDLRNVRPAM
jgi:hypothetical protein